MSAAREFWWTNVWNQMIPIIGQEKAEEIFSDFTSYVHAIVDHYYVNFIQKAEKKQ